MASLLLACAAVCSDRVSKRRKAKREGKKEYDEHFESLKAENMRRESWRQSLSNNQHESMAQVPKSVFDSASPADAPPSYDDIAPRKSIEHLVNGRLGGNTRTVVDQTVVERSTNISPVQRIEARDMARGQS
jgi:hypothetical protein